MFQQISEKFQQWMLVILMLSVCGLLFAFRGDVSSFLTRLAAPSQDVTITSQDDRVVQMRSVLHRDGIPSIDNPKFINASQANSQYTSNELVIGVEIDGDARAYSVPFLSSHEIVNDTVGGTPIAVTW